MKKTREESNHHTSRLIDFIAPDFNDVVSNEYIKGTILKDNDFLEKLRTHLPDGQMDARGLKESLLSAQFQQAMDQLESVATIHF